MSDDLILGIDIGAQGALAMLARNGELRKVAEMPILRDGPADRASVGTPLLADILARWHVKTGCLEFVGASAAKALPSLGVWQIARPLSRWVSRGSLGNSVRVALAGG